MESEFSTLHYKDCSVISIFNWFHGHLFLWNSSYHCSYLRPLHPIGFLPRDFSFKYLKYFYYNPFWLLALHISISLIIVPIYAQSILEFSVPEVYPLNIFSIFTIIHSDYLPYTFQFLWLWTLPTPSLRNVCPRGISFKYLQYFFYNPYPFQYLWLIVLTRSTQHCNG